MIITIHTYTLAISILTYFIIFVFDTSVAVLLIVTFLIGPAYILWVLSWVIWTRSKYEE